MQQIKSGARPSKIDHRDYDYLKNKHPLVYAGVQAPPQFPTEYFTDCGLGHTHNQEVDDYSFTPFVPAQPSGCTNETTCSLATNLTNGLTIYRPDVLEKTTGANAAGGYDIRQSLLKAKGLGWIGDIFNIRAQGIIDFFDAFRLAIVSGAPEKRSVSVGTPWFPTWAAAAAGNSLTITPEGIFIYGAGGVKTGMMPAPTQQEIDMVKKNPRIFPWHNHQLDGWTNKNGIDVLRDESWQGTDKGEDGYLFYDRHTINMVLAISGTVGFTATRMTLPGVKPLPIDTTMVQWIVSFVRNLLGYSY